MLQGTLRLLEWAQIPLSVEEWKAKERERIHLFENSKLLPGVDKLLNNLSTRTYPPIKLALASSAGRRLFALKTGHIPIIAAAFSNPSFHVFGDDPEMADSKKKPEPDIFLLALDRLNHAITANGERPVQPQECLVFEDSIAGVEAARRAKMRVVWVPHPGLRKVCIGHEMDVLMGRTEKNGQPPNFTEYVTQEADLAEADPIVSEDAFAEMRVSLEDFPYETYGIHLSE